MSNKTFEELEVRKLWIELVHDLWKVFYDKTFRNFDFQSQIMRAGISITNNIAEWFERWTRKEFALFLYYSKWSCGEVRSMLYSAKKFGYIDEEYFSETKSKCITLSIKIYNLIKYLKDKNTKEKI